MKEGVHSRRFYEQDSEIRKQWYTRDVTKSAAFNTNCDRYSAPAANWRDTLNCTMAPKSPNPEELPPPCREMLNLAEREFVALNFSGNNYLSWLLDVKIHLNAMGIGDTIVKDNDASVQDRAKAMIIIHHHIQEELKNEYLTIKDPFELWTSLKERYDHQKLIILPKAQYDWIHLRFQDYKSVSDYNSAIFKIVSRLKLCGEEISEEAMIEKTLSTFHATQLLLQQIYRLQKFKKYSELMTCLLVAEQNNELLIQNHNAQPTGSVPFPEANGTSFQRQERTCGRGGRDHGRSPHQSFGNTTYVHQKLDKSNQKRKGGHGKVHKPTKDYVDVCFRCGTKGHRARVCRIPKHLVELYQASIGQVSREKRKEL